MALIETPVFLGKITVTSGVNDSIFWDDEFSPGLTTVIPPGAYYPADLIAELDQAMTDESTASGDGITYT